MKRLIVGTIAAVVLVVVPRALVAQSKTVTSQMRTETATVEAIESATRAVTLKKADGTYVTIVAGPDIKRFDEIKVGDSVTAKYYDNLIIRVKQPGEPDVASRATGTTGSEQALPGGTKAKQVTIPVTITAINPDPAAPTITFTGENGWKYTSAVQDTEALAKVKVGDKVDIVWTQAMLVSLERAK
jgi:hypothetical protein